MESTPGTLDLQIEYIGKADTIAEELSLSPEEKLHMCLIVLASLFIAEAEDSSFVEFDKQCLANLKGGSGSHVYFTARGVLAHLQERGVTRTNARQYLDRRLSEIERGGPIFDLVADSGTN